MKIDCGIGMALASRRELDTERSTEYMPWFKNQRELTFKKGENIELD